MESKFGFLCEMKTRRPWRHFDEQHVDDVEDDEEDWDCLEGACDEYDVWHDVSWIATC